MTNFSLIDRPRFVSHQGYDTVIEKMTARLRDLPGIVSVYLMGSIATPGISDIDMLAVFEENGAVSQNPRANLSPGERYLFPHTLFGVCENHFRDAQDYTFFNGYQLLWGKDLEVGQSRFAPADTKLLKRQIAYEYLVHCYLNLGVQLAYRLVKSRNLLLEARAVLYDLAFLGIKESPLHDLLDRLTDWRARWFTNPPARREIADWVQVFHRQLGLFLGEQLEGNPFYYTPARRYRMARHISIVNDKPFTLSHKGPSLPVFPAIFWQRRYFNLQHRWNRFQLSLPVQDAAAEPILKERLDFENRCRRYNRERLPFFSPLASSLVMTPEE